MRATLCALLALPCLMAQDRGVIIRGATILPISGPAIPNGTIALYKGKIAAIGANIPIPPRMELIDGTGKYVLPGLVDAMTSLGFSANDLNEPGDSFTPQLRAIDAFNPFGVLGTGKP